MVVLTAYILTLVSKLRIDLPLCLLYQMLYFPIRILFHTSTTFFDFVLFFGRISDDRLIRITEENTIKENQLGFRKERGTYYDGSFVIRQIAGKRRTYFF